MIGIDDFTINNSIAKTKSDDTLSQKEATNVVPSFRLDKSQKGNPMEGVIGMTCVATDSMTSWLCFARISDESTEDDPIVIVKSPDPDGKHTEKKIHVNQVNPGLASDMEMFAYLSWNDHIGKKVPGSINSYAAYTSFQTMSGKEKVDSPNDFMNVIRNAYDYVNKPLGFLSKINNIEAKRWLIEGNCLIDIFDASRKG